MFDFDSLDDEIDADEEAFRQEQEKRARHRWKIIEEKQRAEQEKARIQQEEDEEKSRKLNVARAECERLGFNGDWTTEPDLLTESLATLKDWLPQGIQSLRSEASKLKVPTNGLPLGINERGLLIDRMWNGLVWSHLSKEQLQEELNRRSVPFFALDSPAELRTRLTYDTYGSTSGASKPAEVRGSWQQTYKPKSKDNPAPRSPWTGQRAELGPDPHRGEGKGKGKWDGISPGRISHGGTAKALPRSTTSGKGRPQAAAPPTPANEGPYPRQQSGTSIPGERNASFLKAFPKFSGKLPSREEEQQWSNLQMHVYFNSNGEIRMFSDEQEAKRNEDQKQGEAQKHEKQEDAEDVWEREARRLRERQQHERVQRDREQQEARQRAHEKQKRQQREEQEKNLMMQKLADSYDALGLPPGASFNEVRRAYRSLALLHHPDKQQSKDGDASMFRRITAAYDAICKVRKRD
mmetsp:Transcript_56339/g.98400  ORF Transcript_56339/g.98400 Transcript_56339/m.98400 type:complete len:465 (-) Transcript_56339:147-1541(-)